jgi:Zn finger protein HypA/HybF involved in hydrogenase expression
LVEPECQEEKIICKHCNQPANIIDSQYYQCWNCAGRIVKLDINSE